MSISRLRIKLLASSLPLLLVGAFVGGDMTAADRPCISLGGATMRIAAHPWQAQLRIGFTDDRARATVRVQIVERAEDADFAVVDDIGASSGSGSGSVAEGGSCGIAATASYVAIGASSPADPLIYLSAEGGADYKIHVRSKTFSPREAAALIVSAHHGDPRIAAAL